MNWRRVFAAAAVVILIGVLAFVLVRTFTGTPEVSPEPQAEPRYTIAIDAGHGGRDPGAVVDGVLEKDVNLALAKRLRDLVDADPDLRAVLTRTADVFVPLEDRILRAEEAGATIYLSIHANSFDQPEVHGIETWVDDSRSDDDPSWILATMVQAATAEATGARDRGLRSQDSYLQRAQMPAVSIEVGYLSHPDERERLLSAAYQDTLASGIIEGIHRYLEWLDPPAE